MSELPEKVYERDDRPGFPYQIGGELGGATINSLANGGSTTGVGLDDGRNATYQRGSDTRFFWKLIK